MTVKRVPVLIQAAAKLFEAADAASDTSRYALGRRDRHTFKIKKVKRNKRAKRKAASPLIRLANQRDIFLPFSFQ